MEAAGERADEIVVEDGVPQPSTEKRDRRIGVHHSALERNVRHRTEAEALRSGKLRTVVCSTSLEALGVDIGYVDRVLVLGGARGMTPTLQRVGRAGHRPGAVATGVVIAQDRDDIVDSGGDPALHPRRRARGDRGARGAARRARAVAGGPGAPDNRVAFADALVLARRAYPYRELAEADLRACAAYLSGGGAGPDEAHVRRIGMDAEAVYGLGREPSSAYFENVGTIPDEQTIAVAGAGGHGIGRLDESFAASLREGDVILLEGRTLKVKEMGPRGLRVEPHAGRPTVPTWSSHMKGVPRELAAEIDRLRGGVAEALRGGTQRALAYLKARYGLAGVEAAHVVRYVAQQLALSDLPAPTRPVIEIYRMDKRQTAVFHTMAGRRVNETLARVVGARLHARHRTSSTLTTDDGGFLVALPARKSVPDAAWASLLGVEDFDADLLAALRSGYMLRQQFRYVANTGLLVLRRAGGRSIRGGALRWNAQRSSTGLGGRPRLPADPRDGARGDPRAARRAGRAALPGRPGGRAARAAPGRRDAVHLRHRHLVVQRLGGDGRPQQHDRGAPRARPRGARRDPGRGDRACSHERRTPPRAKTLRATMRMRATTPLATTCGSARSTPGATRLPRSVSGW